MAKIFTPTSLLLKKEKSPKKNQDSQETSFEPSDYTIEFLLNYSKSLDLIATKSIDYIDNIKN